MTGPPMLTSGFHEERCRKWLNDEPDPDVLEEVVTDQDIHTREGLQAQQYITVKKPLGFNDGTLWRVTAESSPVLTPAVVRATLAWAEELAGNDALTPELLAEAVTATDEGQLWIEGSTARRDSLLTLLRHWDEERVSAFEQELAERTDRPVDLPMPSDSEPTRRS